MRSVANWRRSAAGLAILASACTTQLAPAYDQSIATGLVSTNTSMHVLFATIGAGVDKSTYSTRAEDYNKVIGELQALEIEAKSRPLPASDVLTKVNAALNAGKTTPIDPQFSDYPSARAMQDAANTIIHMRDADQKAGLRGNEVAGFENQADIFMTQAITYEDFLKR
jgi:hypothetical protein